MNKEFIYNHNLCVNCGACSAACVLANNWNTRPRNIYEYNSDLSVKSALVNLSLACNHCQTAPCIEGCPSSALYRDTDTNAVLINDLNCIGCKFCQWNCPYDAPKFSNISRTIEKCHMCHSLISSGEDPVCTSACPTGALSFGDQIAVQTEDKFPWFPEKNTDPAVSFVGNKQPAALEIIPEGKFGTYKSDDTARSRKISDDWSLITFTFLVLLLVSKCASSLINGIYPEATFVLTSILLAASVSLFHLGKPLRAYKSVFNLKKSPLSKEILLFLIFSLSTVLAKFTHIPALLIVSSVIGLLLLIVIDSVYLFSDKRLSVLTHSGQTFLSGLMIISFLSGYRIPFSFIALLKFCSIIYKFLSFSPKGIQFAVRFIRLAFLFITVISLTSGLSDNNRVILLIFLTGELIDRIVFYIDFSPINIKTEIITHLNSESDEKKRG